jgi:hypothetical protein
VFGLSLSLAALSHVRWSAKRAGVPLRSAIGWDSFLAPFFAGLVLFSTGLALGASRTWEQIAWVVLALLFALQAILAAREVRRARLAPECSAKEESAHETSE